MRPIALVILLFVVAGCAAPPPPTTDASTGASISSTTSTSSVTTSTVSAITRSGPVAVVIVQGTIQETGPAYQSGQGCGRAANNHVVDEARQEVWYVDAAGPSQPDLLAADSILLAQPNGCGSAGPDAERVIGFMGGGNITVDVDGYQESRRLERVGDEVHFAGMRIPAGNATTWNIHWTVQRQPQPYDDRSGLYSYDGTLTVRSAGLWSATGIHKVEGCGELPGGC